MKVSTEFCLESKSPAFNFQTSTGMRIVLCYASILLVSFSKNLRIERLL